MAHYVGLNKKEVWELTLPQLNYYLKKCNEHIEFTVKVSTMSLGMFGGGTVPSTDEDISETDADGYKEATEEDMEWLAKLL